MTENKTTTIAKTYPMADKENKLAPDTEEGEEKNGMGKENTLPPLTHDPPLPPPTSTHTKLIEIL